MKSALECNPHSNVIRNFWEKKKKRNPRIVFEGIRYLNFENKDMRVTHHFSHMIIPRKLNFSKVEKWDSVRRRIHTIPNYHFWSKKLFLGKTFDQKMNDKKFRFLQKIGQDWFFSTSIFGWKYRFLAWKIIHELSKINESQIVFPWILLS